MQKIYIVLSRSHTILARAIRIFTKKYYNHTSIAFDESLQPFYSFGRRNPKLMFPAGFITEGVHTGFFGLHPDTRICVLETEVTDEDIKIIQERLKPFTDAPLNFKYGVFQMPKMMTGRTYVPENQFVCSVFVAHLLKDIVPFTKDYSLIYPEDYFDYGFKKIYEGTAGDYKYEQQ